MFKEGEFYDLLSEIIQRSKTWLLHQNISESGQLTGVAFAIRPEGVFRKNSWNKMTEPYSNEFPNNLDYI